MKRNINSHIKEVVRKNQKGRNLEKVKLYDQILLSDDCKSIVLGSILGDGKLKINKGNKNARLSIRHSEVQREYYEWKVSKLLEIAAPKSTQEQEQEQKPTGNSKKRKLLYQSRSLETLTMIYNLTYKENKLVIKRRWLNHLTPLALAIWWMEEGRLISKKKKGVICTDGLKPEEVKKIERYLWVKWGVKTKMREKTKEYKGEIKRYPRLWIESTEELKKWVKIIEDHIPERMKNKIEIKRTETQ